MKNLQSIREIQVYSTLRKGLTFVLILIASFYLCNCKSKTEVRKLAPLDVSDEKTKRIAPIKAGKKNETDRIEGVIYRLPRTVIQANVPIKMTSKNPGEFSDFAPCFFSDEDLQEWTKVAEKKFNIENPTLSSRGEPDPDETYVVKTTGNYFEAKTLFMEYSPTGILIKGEAESKEESLDFALKTIRTVVGLGLKISSAGILGVDGGSPATFSKEDLLEKAKSCQSKIAVKTKTIRVINNSEELTEEYEKALAVFLKLESIQERRDKLVSTATDVSPDTFKLMLTETDNSIKDYRAAFLGVATEKVWTGVFEFPPETGVSQDSELIFKYSKEEGVCTNEGLVNIKNINVKKAFQNIKRSEKPCGHSLILQIAQAENDEDFILRVKRASENSTNSAKSRGWYYRIPARADISLVECGLQPDGQCDQQKRIYMARNEMMIAQLGASVSMPAATAGRSSSSSVVLDEATGALRNFKVSSSPLLDEKTLEEAEKTAQNAIDAADPLTKKKRELELLKTQNEINKQRKEINELNSPPDDEKKP